MDNVNEVFEETHQEFIVDKIKFMYINLGWIIPQFLIGYEKVSHRLDGQIIFYQFDSKLLRQYFAFQVVAQHWIRQQDGVKATVLSPEKQGHESYCAAKYEKVKNLVVNLKLYTFCYYRFLPLWMELSLRDLRVYHFFNVFLRHGLGRLHMALHHAIEHIESVLESGWKYCIRVKHLIAEEVDPPVVDEDALEEQDGWEVIPIPTH
jgi:hypothetical protein